MFEKEVINLEENIWIKQNKKCFWCTRNIKIKTMECNLIEIWHTNTFGDIMSHIGCRPNGLTRATLIANKELYNM